MCQVRDDEFRQPKIQQWYNTGVHLLFHEKLLIFCPFSEIQTNRTLEFDGILFLAYMLRINEATLSNQCLFCRFGTIFYFSGIFLVICFMNKLEKKQFVQIILKNSDDELSNLYINAAWRSVTNFTKSSTPPWERFCIYTLVHLLFCLKQVVYLCTKYFLAYFNRHY